uniref:Uncharacterized protein n=1 Tax=Anguilla anguilla TaxID=7936 RepID=A0A0E9XAE4_ANGAN
MVKLWKTSLPLQGHASKFCWLTLAGSVHRQTCYFFEHSLVKTKVQSR